MLRSTWPLAAALALAGVSLLACDGPTPEPLLPPQPVPGTGASAAAAPPDPPPVTDGDVTVAYAGGVQILVKRIPGAELSAMGLFIKGGARNWTAANAGVERLALTVATSGGTESLDKDTFHRRLATLGSEISTETKLDYAAIKGKTLLSHWDETFDLLAGTFLHPALPASELELRREKQLQTLRHEQESPDAELGLLVHQTVFKGHPFEDRAIGTADSVGKLSLEAVKTHLGMLRETSRLLFVTVGDVDPGHVVEKVKGALGALPRGDYQGAPFPALTFEKASVTVREKALQTNYIQGSFVAPGWGSPDFADAMVAMNVLRFRLFEEVRTKRNLSYAPSSGLASSTTVPLGFLYVTAVDPNATMKVMLDEARKLQNEPVPEKDLAGTKATFLTRYLMQNEGTEGQADMLASAQILGGDWKLARTLPDQIRAVTSASVQTFTRKYVQHLQLVVLGDPAKIDRALFGSL